MLSETSIRVARHNCSSHARIACRALFGLITALAAASFSASSAAQQQTDSLVARFGHTNITLPISYLTSHSDAIPFPKPGIVVDVTDNKTVFLTLPSAQSASMHLCSGMEQVALIHSRIPRRSQQKVFRNTSVTPSEHPGISQVVGAPVNLFQFDDGDLLDGFDEPISFVNSRSSETIRRVDLWIQITEDLRIRTVTFDEICFFKRGADATRTILRMLRDALDSK